MKTSLKAVLKKNVGPWPFILTCLVLAIIAVAATFMAHQVLQEQARTMEQPVFVRF